MVAPRLTDLNISVRSSPECPLRTVEEAEQDSPDMSVDFETEGVDPSAPANSTFWPTLSLLLGSVTMTDPR